MRYLLGAFLGEDRKELFRLVSKFSTAGLEMGFSVVIGLIMGIYLDSYLKTDPWMTIVFLIFGVVAAFRVIIRIAKEGRQEE